MNIAAIFNNKIISGGAFQQELSVILLLNKNKNSKYNFIFFTTIKENVAVLAQYNIKAVYLRLSPFALIRDKIRRFVNRYKLMSRYFGHSSIDMLLMPFDIDLIYFLSPSGLALKTEKMNYVFTVWDLCHRDMPEFPEVSKNGVFESRENLYKKALPKAIKVFTDSEVGKKKLVHRYSLDENRIMVLHYLPSVAVRNAKAETEIKIKHKYGLTRDYVYYPAQFWGHKNHIYVLEGLKVLKEKYNVKIDAIFSGEDKGNLSFVLKRAKELNIADQVHYIGFVANEEIPCLYEQSLALVMPTYLGPTNIPPLEAFALGVPVLYSDREDLRDFVNGAALLTDLGNPDSMAVNILKIINRDPVVSKIIEKGKKKIAEWGENNYWDVVKRVFDEYETIMHAWK